MPRLLCFYLAKRFALSTLLIESTLCVPVVMAALFQNLSAAALRGGLLVPAVFGTLPTVLYIALPMAVGLAVALEFARMSSEGMIAVLYSLRLSASSIALPAVFVAGLAVVAGYSISLFIAPNYVGQMQDVINVVRNSLNHRMLEPGRFYTFDNGARTLYFQRWRSADVVSGMFIHQFSAEKNEDEIITAADTEFRRNDQGVVMIMSNGSIQTRPIGSSAMRTANFDEYVLTIDMQGASGLPKRNWRGVFELPGAQFFREQPNRIEEPRRFAEWMSEAATRLGIPLLALAHTLLAIGLVLRFSNISGRTSKASGLIVLAVPAVHVAILIGAETVVRQDPSLVYVVILAIIAEFAVGILLIWRQNANFRAIDKVPQDACLPA
jgi:lipopolysaccharide export system permease protein